MNTPSFWTSDVAQAVAQGLPMPGMHSMTGLQAASRTAQPARQTCFNLYQKASSHSGHALLSQRETVSRTADVSITAQSSARVQSAPLQ